MKQEKSIGIEMTLEKKIIIGLVVDEAKFRSRHLLPRRNIADRKKSFNQVMMPSPDFKATLCLINTVTPYPLKRKIIKFISHMSSDFICIVINFFPLSVFCEKILCAK